jgi:DMSO/TMAO reductase YedYZ molybdopterin-dependent catalytic subunit
MDTTRGAVATAAASGVAGVAGSFAVVGFTPAFVGAALATAVAKLSPGVLVTFAITVLGDVGRLVNVVAALLLAAGLFAALALGGVWVARSLEIRAAAPLVGGASAFAVATLVTGAPLASLGAGVGTALPLAVAAAGPVDASAGTGVSGARRRLLATVGTGLAAVGIGYPIGVARGPGVSAETPIDDPVVRRLLDDASAKSLDVAGLEPLVSDRFYTVDIAAADPTIDPTEWSLSVTGNVDQEVTVDYDEVTGMASREVFSTLRCVGESLNGKKMDNALWTVVDAEPLLERAGVDGRDNCCVMLRAADGYYEEFPLAALRDGLLAYRMNGRALPRSHGAPVRALIPGHWGEINVKWLTEIEVLDEEAEGYWEERGWHGTGPVNTVAKLHATERDGDEITVAGHAYAGTRGISAVEVSTDGGDTWADARLSEPLGDPEADATDAWRQWAYTYTSPGERHEVVVRAREADGTLQPSEESNAFPSGPSGWVTQELDG